MRTVAVSGAASGIGAAVRRRLEADDCRVIGIDLRDAEIAADLGSPAGRTDAVRRTLEASGGRLDGAVACAGVGPQVDDRSLLARVNYFGAVAVLDGLRPALAAARGAAVAVGSNSATLPTVDARLVDTCLAGDEPAAAAQAAVLSGPASYASGKRALARWVRAHAPGAAWAGTGIRLNAVMPGAVDTPLLQGGLADAVIGPAIRAFPVPLGIGRPEQVAAAISFLLGDAASFCCGSLLFVDGGSDALFFPERC